jgi:hypothetical protein
LLHLKIYLSDESSQTVNEREQCLQARLWTCLCVGVSQLDGNVSLQFVLEPDSLDTGDGLDDGGLSVGYVTDSTDVDLRRIANGAIVISIKWLIQVASADQVPKGEEPGRLVTESRTSDDKLPGPR